MINQSKANIKISIFVPADFSDNSLSLKKSIKSVYKAGIRYVFRGKKTFTKAACIGDASW